MKMTIKTFILIASIFMSFASINSQTYFTDNFENGLGQWIVGGNNWDTLSSTYTSSNHCATDSRVGNYTYNSDPTITMSQTLNLAGSTFPVLTFFQRYSLVNCNNGADDFIYVEISTNSGFNWNIVQSWQFTNFAWSYIQFDLRNYQSNLFKIRFRLSSHNNCGTNADGWYIDDVKISEYNTINTTLKLPFSDGFENGMSKWIVGGFNWDTTSINPNSGLRCVTDSKAGNYLYASAPTMTLNGILNLTNTTFPIIEFFHRYSLVNCNNGADDFIYVEISTNGGFSWNTIQLWQFTNSTWGHEQFDLSNYRSNSVKIRFQLSSYNNCGTSADGWHIDDILIRDLATGVSPLENSIPDRYSLKQNYPNPFNPSTNIEFSVPKQSNVKINVYDSQGKEVAALLNEKLSAGTYRVDFDGTGYSSGIYFYKLETESFIQTKSMVLLK